MSPVKDRLKDLEKQIEIKQDNVKLINNLQKENKKLRQIFDKVEELREQIDGIKGNTERIKNVLEKFYVTARKELHAEIQSLFDAFTKKSKKITDILKVFEAELQKQTDQNSTEARIKILQYNSLKKEFLDIVAENHEILLKYNNYMLDMYKKSIKITYNDIKDDELESLLSEKDMLQIFIDNHLVETESAIKQLDDLKARHAEILSLEEQIRDVHSLFLQMSILVEQQQESLDRVEYHALNAREYVEQGAVDISKSQRSKTKRRKMKIIIFVALVIIILILIIMLVK